MGQHRKTLDDDGTRRYEKAKELCADDIGKIDQIVREILSGKQGLPQVTGPRRNYLYNVITPRLRSTILAKKRREAKKRPLEHMFGKNVALHMRREAERVAENTPESSR